MNNITNGLEFMREEELSVLPKILFITGSFLLFFAVLFTLGAGHRKVRCADYPRLCLAGTGQGWPLPPPWCGCGAGCS